MGYRYITPEVVSSGKFNAGSAEEFSEAEAYNKEVLLGHVRKGKLLAAWDAYRTISVIALLMSLCVVLKPALFHTNAGPNIAATIIAAVGYAYLAMRYIIKDPGDPNGSAYLPRKSAGGRVYGGSDEIRRGIGTGLLGAILIGAVLALIFAVAIKNRPTINYTVSAAAFGGCVLTAAFFVFSNKRRNVFAALPAAALYVLVSPILVPYALLAGAAAFISDKIDRGLRDMEGYPDFVPLKVTSVFDTNIKVKSYDGYNREDGIDDEMESI